jgi:hypothetical protein
MAFEELNENTERFQQDTKSFLEATFAYHKLKMFKLAMLSTSLIFKILLVGLGLSVFLLFCSLAAAFAIGEAVNSNSLGFLILGGLYLLFTILIYSFRRRLIEGLILRLFSKIFFND